MNADAGPARVFRAEYRRPDFWVDHVGLEIDLDMEETRVRTRLSVRPNPEFASGAPCLVLDCEAVLESVAVDGRPLKPGDYSLHAHKLTLPGVTEASIIETQTVVSPKTNTAVMGISPTHDGELFSQCEAEGFRRFAVSLDRPDVLSTFDVLLKADKSTFPVLLSNGHPIARGDLEDGRHWVRWEDRSPKPCYLFALFAGRLDRIGATFVTRSGRPVEVGLYTRTEYMETCRPALDFVLKAMRWDEDAFGREYDMGVFNIGVMNGFAGAMENKGLNLFDLAWVAAGSNATDDEYEYRMKSVAHEYFHHWSGDKVTVANWFQVSLKEGLTRFRDQLFLGDVTESTSVRIKMARHMRGNQFTEDDSATAHAPVLDSYIETRNVYTNTVYDKGQEAIFMLMAKLGREKFQTVVSAYFDQYEDQAVTIEEFLGVFESKGGLDLRQFRRWYYQAGLTEVSVTGRHDPVAERYVVELRQSTIPTPGAPVKQPHDIPFSVRLLDREGRPMTALMEGESAPSAEARVLAFREPHQTFVFKGVPAAPVLSRLRSFSAPVRLKEVVADEDLAVLTRHDDDLFARWDAGQSYAGRIIGRLGEAFHAGALASTSADPAFIDAYLSALNDQSLSARAKADLLTLPDERTLGDESPVIDVDGVHAGRSALAYGLAAAGEDFLWAAYDQAKGAAEEDRSNDAVGRRRLMAVTLDYLSRLDDGRAQAECLDLVQRSANFTEQVLALGILAEQGGPHAAVALDSFWDRHKGDHLALDRWYRAQAIAARDDTAATVDRIMDAPDFEPLFSRLFFGLCEPFFYLNRYGLNAPGGHGHAVFAKQILRIDRQVPMIAGWTLARSDMTRWWKFDPVRQASMRAALQTLIDDPGASAGVVELGTLALAGAPKGA